MPELPEVEVIARGLNAGLPGRTIQSVEVFWERSVAPPISVAQFIAGIAGQSIRQVWRRGKFLIVDLENGKHLLVHLRMTGRLCIEPARTPLSPHVRARFRLDDEIELHFSDVRKFGRLYLTDDLPTVIGKLGPEPLSDTFTAGQFARMLEGRRGCIKPLLLDQPFIAGLGNIYVDESLFHAGIHPLRRAGSLNMEESRRLHGEIRRILKEAIQRRGTTLNDYRDAEGQTGEQQNHLAVYGRTGDRCMRCGEVIQRIVVSQRGTHFCPRCQSERAGNA